MSSSGEEPFAERKAQLTPLEFQVTQGKVTERPFSNKYNRHWAEGTYHCVVCNREIFKSDTKFESKSGWPAFSNVVDTGRVHLKPDLSHVGVNLLLLVSRPDLARTEVSCSNCKAHLGHLFKDGPKPTGLRYCVNSTSLHFIPAETNSDLGDQQGLPSPSETENASRSKTGNSCEGGSAKMCFFPTNMNSIAGAAGTASTPSSSANCTANDFPPNGFIGRKQQGMVERISSRPSDGVLRETSL